MRDLKPIKKQSIYISKNAKEKNGLGCKPFSI